MSTAAYAAQRARFLDDSVATATPARLLTMLYDRLVLDLARAEAAQRADEWETASQQLLHAQEIVLELASSLRTDEWEGGPPLLALYGFLHSQLVLANVAREPERTRKCGLLVEPLRDAWHAAALEVTAGAPLAAAGASG